MFRGPGSFDIISNATRFPPCMEAPAPSPLPRSLVFGRFAPPFVTQATSFFLLAENDTFSLLTVAVLPLPPASFCPCPFTSFFRNLSFPPFPRVFGFENFFPPFFQVQRSSCHFEKRKNPFPFFLRSGPDLAFSTRVLSSHLPSEMRAHF